MGSNTEEGDMSLHYFTLNNKFQIMSHEVIKLDERVRDIVYIKKLNKVLLFLESSASIGILEKKN
jgi:hypothetical protein